MDNINVHYTFYRIKYNQIKHIINHKVFITIMLLCSIFSLYQDIYLLMHNYKCYNSSINDTTYCLVPLKNFNWISCIIYINGSSFITANICYIIITLLSKQLKFKSIQYITTITLLALITLKLYNFISNNNKLIQCFTSPFIHLISSLLLFWLIVIFQIIIESLKITYNITEYICYKVMNFIDKLVIIFLLILSKITGKIHNNIVKTMEEV